MKSRACLMAVSILAVFILCSAVSGCGEKAEQKKVIAVESFSTEDKEYWTLDSLCGQAEEYIKMYIDTGKAESKWIYTALQRALEARKLDKTSPLPHTIMAKAYMAKGEPSKAYERLQMAIKLAPEDGEVKRMVSEIRAQDIASQGGMAITAAGVSGKKYKDGSYVGGMKENSREGYGIFTGSDGWSYTGDWGEDKKDGHGRQVWANGDIYSGEWNKNNRDGHGLYEWTNGTIYAGEWEHSKRNGHGRQTYENKDEYVGEWVDGKRTGEGYYKWSTGEVYYGEFLEGKKQGHGKSVFADGRKYIGEFQDNKAYTGHGTAYYKSGDVYTGQMNAGNRHGHGSMKGTNGIGYVGQYLNNQQTCHGSIFWPNGHSYTGQFQGGKKHGHGLYVWPNKNKYVGLWDNDRAIGGYFYASNGNRTWAYQNDQGQWVHKKQ